MKRIYIAACGAMLLTLCTSCGEDFLFKAPQGTLDANALTSAYGVDLLTTNAYATFTENDNASDWGASLFNWTFGGIYGGDANKGSDNNDQSMLNSMEMYALVPTNSYLNEKWRWIYKGSKRVAVALQTLESVKELDPEVKKYRIGELHFLRALFYFEGIKVFGPYIPYVDEKAHAEDNNPKIKNDRDIYDDILRDAQTAIDNLPEKPSEPGRAYKWAAKALQAKILMQRGDMAKAKPVLRDVIENGSTATGKRYALASDLSDNWDSFKDNTSPESIFEIQFSVDGNDNGNAGMSLCYPHNTGAPGGCCGFYQPSFELVNSYQVDENGLPFLEDDGYRLRPSISDNPDLAVDPRLDFTVGRIGIPYKDYGPAQASWVRDQGNGGPFLPKKHVYSKAEEEAGLGRGNVSLGWSPGSAMNIQYLSLRDIKLLYAECLVEEGDLSGAIAQVNGIRERAGRPENKVTFDDGTSAANYRVALYPQSHPVYTDKELCRRAVRFERKLELAMEGIRWFDLTRWGGDYMAKELSDYVDYEKGYIGKFEGARKLPADKTMFPIPQEQINTMGNDPSGEPYLVQAEPWR